MCFSPKVSMPKVEPPATPAEPVKDDPAPVSYGASPTEDKEKSGTASLKVDKPSTATSTYSKPPSTNKSKITSKFGMNKSRK